MSQLHHWYLNLAQKVSLVLKLVAYVDLVTKLGLIVHIRSESRLDTNRGLTGIASVATGPLSVPVRRGQRRVAWVFAENPLEALFLS